MDASRSGTKLHKPVLLEPVLAALDIKADGNYIDGTFGRGGHSRAILQRLGPAGRLLAIDRDPEAIAEADAALAQDARFELIRNDFAEIGHIAVDRGLGGSVDGILLDLGVSSPQLDRGHRGFSFQHDGPLDMRMDPERGQSAAAWLATVEERELSRVLRRFGEERYAPRIARAIVAARDEAPVDTTARLAELVSAAAPQRARNKHPATRTFQAIRAFLNDELGQLERALRASLEVLRKHGRLCVISFHSLEDRLVKRFIRDESREPEAFRGLPEVPEAFRPKLKPVGRSTAADEDEIKANPRSRSARLRVAERL